MTNWQTSNTMFPSEPSKNLHEIPTWIWNWEKKKQIREEIGEHGCKTMY